MVTRYLDRCVFNDSNSNGDRERRLKERGHGFCGAMIVVGTSLQVFDSELVGGNGKMRI